MEWLAAVGSCGGFPVCLEHRVHDRVQVAGAAIALALF
jgi:hypothetical protein